MNSHLSLLYGGVAILLGTLLGWVLRSMSARDLKTIDGYESSATPEHLVKAYAAFPIKTKKHPQMILAMAADFFDQALHFAVALNRIPAHEFFAWHETASALVLKERGALEPDGNYRQLLPYTIVRRLGANGVWQYLAYQRTNLVGEQRLAGKISVGFGGHIDASSVVWVGDTIDLASTIYRSAERERDEELKIKGSNEPSPWGLGKCVIKYGDAFITQDSDPERMHLGIVMYIEPPPGIELECAESELVTLGWRTAGELLALHERGEIRLEAWSELVLLEESDADFNI